LSGIAQGDVFHQEEMFLTAWQLPPSASVFYQIGGFLKQS
jgi:hypothetical protein